jgi:hypothetical protein
MGSLVSSSIFTWILQIPILKSETEATGRSVHSEQHFGLGQAQAPMA